MKINFMESIKNAELGNNVRVAKVGSIETAKTIGGNGAIGNKSIDKLVRAYSKCVGNGETWQCDILSGEKCELYANIRAYCKNLLKKSGYSVNINAINYGEIVEQNANPIINAWNDRNGERYHYTFKVNDNMELEIVQ